MADPFGVSKGSNPSNPFKVKTSGGGKHGGSLVGNLAHDVGAAVTGLPRGIVDTVSHPVRTVENLAKVEAQTWSPLIHGQFGKFYKGFHEHPLGPILDVATLLGFAGARGVALASLPEDATGRELVAAAARGHYAGPLKTLTGRAAEGGADVTLRVLPRNAARAARMQAIDRALKVLPPETRVVGEFARAARAVRAGALPTQLAHLLDGRYADYLKAWHGLKKEERVAVALLARVPLREDLERWRELLPKDDAVGQRLAAQTLDPKVLAAYERPSEKVLAAHTAAAKLAQAREEILTATTKVAPETVASRPFLHMRIARGATFQPESKALIQATAERDRVARLHEKALARETAWRQKVGAAVADVVGQPGGPRQDIFFNQFGQHFPTSVLGSDGLSVHNIHDAHGNVIGSMQYDARPGKHRIYVESVFIRPEFRSVSNFQRLLEPVVKDGRPISAELQNPRLQRLLERASGGRIAAGSKPLARHDEVVIERGTTPEGALPELWQPTGRIGGPSVALGNPHRERIVTLGHALELAQAKVERVAGKGARTEAGFVGGGSVEQLRAEVAAAGRPQPFYLPDVPLTEKPRGGFTRNPSGRTPPRALADVFQNSGALHRVGLLALEPDVLGPKFLSAINHDYKLALHQEVLRLAEPMDHLRPGYEWVRAMRGQRIPFTASARETHAELLDERFPGLVDETPLTVKAGEEAEVATDASGRRLAVSREFAQELEGEAQRSSDFVRLVVEKPLQVWRALVLNLRIPWLINNMLGNTVLAAVRFSGLDGLKAFLGMVGETRGVRAVRQLLGDAETRNHLTPEDMAAVYPELTRAGTFLGSQTEDLGRAGTIARKASIGLAPLDAATESALRRASTETALRRTVEAKTIYRAMPAQTRSWRAAMLQASENPDVRSLVVREVNDALGNFLSLSPAEKRLRNIVPFYAWYREITRIALKLPLDQPGRADLLAKLGQLGDELNSGDLGPVPSYLRGAIPLGGVNGDGSRSLILTQAGNPYTSALQVGQSVGGLAGLGNRRLGAQAALGEANPFAAGLFTYLVKAAGGDKTRGPEGAIPNVVSAVGKQLPQVRVVTNPPSRLYPGRTRQDLLQWLLGDPRRRISPAIAREYARRENG